MTTDSTAEPAAGEPLHHWADDHRPVDVLPNWTAKDDSSNEAADEKDDR